MRKTLKFPSLSKEAKASVNSPFFFRILDLSVRTMATLIRDYVAIYTELIDSFAKSGNWEEAMKLFERMKDEGLERDEFAYGVTVNASARPGNWRRPWNFFEFYSENGVGETVKLFIEMVEKGCMWESYCYNALIDAFVKNEEALKLCEMMIHKCITPTPASFRALSTGLCPSGKIARVSFDDMRSVLCKVGCVEQACKLADGIVDGSRDIPGKVRAILPGLPSRLGTSSIYKVTVKTFRRTLMVSESITEWMAYTMSSLMNRSTEYN
ncbi:hypothetical protein HHK36_005402 [Tetracentron sinense]|uniref:Pentatricopeptide repeat-containing protein n=1 Tax=Tetracentron sinense TaxID=13715 RepID=A0A834ZVC9_TETSI|nr:hypothetical protein HHK36_005402 [Tetracentron sinense]